MKRKSFLKKTLSLFLVLTMMFSSTNVFAQETTTEAKTNTTVFSLTDYTLATLEDNSSVEINSSIANVNGNIYSAGDFAYTGSQLNVTGECNAVGIITNKNQVNFKKYEEGVEKLQFPNYLIHIRTSMSGDLNVYEQDQHLKSNTVTIDKDIFAKDNLYLTASILNGSSCVVANKNIKINTSLIRTNKDKPLVLVSEKGNININSSMDDFNGIIYAPNGTVEINSTSFNFSGKIIAKKIIINSSNTNITDNNEYADKYLQVDRNSTSWDDMVDSDKDGLPDEYESDIGTKPDNPDTDGDGLPDGYEVMESCTDPISKNTDNNSITDDLWDIDEDGLTNMQEYIKGTDPLNPDTDDDGLIDADETDKYKTDPLKFDTDEDRLGDGSEIGLGLDPNNPETFGYPDSEYVSNQSVSQESPILEDINNNDNPYKLSLDIRGSGSLNDSLLVRKSAYTEAMKNDAILGVVPEIIYNDFNIENATLKFQVDKQYVGNDDSIFAQSYPEFVGIKRYNVFMYFEDDNMMLPVKTQHDTENNIVIADVDRAGTYCVVDMEIWLETLGIMPAIDTELTLNSDSIKREFKAEAINFDDSLFNASSRMIDTDNSRSVNLMSSYNFNETLSDDEGFNKDKLDVVFMINTNANMTDKEFKSVKYNIIEVSKHIFSESKNARVYILEMNGSLLVSSQYTFYATSAYEIEQMLSTVVYDGYKTVDIDPGYLKMVNGISFRTDATKICFDIDNGFYSHFTNWSKDLPTILKSLNISTSIICPNTQLGSLYCNMALNSGGKLFKNWTEFPNEVLKYIYGYIPKLKDNDYKVITSSGLMLISLDGELSPTNGIDTDKDSLTDWKEVDSSLITLKEDGRVVLPSLYDCIVKKGNGDLFYVEEGMYRFVGFVGPKNKNFEELIKEIYIIPIKSDPTSADGDKDGILDIDEKWDGVDIRYKKINPLRKDTVETLFPELSSPRGSNKEKNPSYLEIKGNDVTMHLRVMFKGDANKNAATAFKTTYGDYDKEEESVSNSIIKSLGGSYTFKDVLIDGIKNRWGGDYSGSEFDFYKGMKVKFDVNIKEQKEKKFLEKTIEVNVKPGVCGVSNQSGVNWKSNCNRIITMYSSYCNIEAHKNKSGSECSEYNDNLYSIAVYEGIAAHEFGHVFGLKDMYPEARNNHGFYPKSQKEIWYSNDSFDFGLPLGEGIMIYNGRAKSNDIEMVLTAFEQNEWQYFVPYGKKQKISSAIKEDQIYMTEDDDKTQYIWDKTNYKFIIKS